MKRSSRASAGAVAAAGTRSDDAAPRSATACDVLVIGGGPAGATAAALLAERGYGVVLLEKDVHPRFHIGESLLPQNLALFERLGVMNEVARIGVFKPGAEFVSETHPEPVSFAFANGLDPRYTHSFHVRRSEFDELLFRNCASRGVDAREGMRVKDATLRWPARSEVVAADDAGGEHRWAPRFVVDASGRDTFLAGRLKLKERNRHNNTGALFAHFTGVSPLKASEEGYITIHLFDEGWFWVIPLRDGVTSVGLVSNPAFFKSRTGSVEQFLLAQIGRCTSLARRMERAALAGPVTATGNYSYQARSIGGDGYLLIGDAFAFIDPVFSSGVMLAMSTAASAVEVVDAYLKGAPDAAQARRGYERLARQALESFSWLIYRINRPVLRDMFMNPSNRFRMRQGLVSLLAGNVHGDAAPTLPILAFKGAYYFLSAAYLLGFRLGPDGLSRRAG